VNADETRLGQVLVNLLVNAAQAIPPGNTDNNEVRIATRTNDEGKVVVEIADTGIGMPPEVLSRIFEPFFTTKSGGGGTGLGLSICHGIVASFGGELTAESRVGKGSTFRLTLPPGVEPHAASRPASAVAARMRGRLLLIDDEDMMLNAVSRVLDGHEVVVMKDARSALSRLENDDRFDIVLCDLMMPNMTGMDFYEELLRRRPDIAHRVVFMTGGAMTPKTQDFLDTVPNRRIQKPFSGSDLQGMVQRILAEDSVQH
jgi:CheY-like chemotaxis protein/anti-sigma regulatory factor (Ser/Thr protein kinase)